MTVRPVTGGLSRPIHGSGAERPAPERFGDDGADADALSETLFDPERRPVFRVPAADGPGAIVVAEPRAQLR
ncbi:hypothetical protein DXZ75_08055 [Streptomyces sp. AcE210]|nr:hypothetical protein DXZ75_08055 [Streptomyces sp. AcE210]